MKMATRRHPQITTNASFFLKNVEVKLMFTRMNIIELLSFIYVDEKLFMN